MVFKPEKTMAKKCVDCNTNVVDRYLDCFVDVGKMKSYQLEILIDLDIETAIRSMRIIYILRDKLSKMIDEIEQYDIIKDVNEPRIWI